MVVERVAPPPDLTVTPGLHPVRTELLHRERKVLEERGLVRRVPLDERPRSGVDEERRVRRQKPQPPRQVLEVQVVELPWRHHVVEGGDGWILQVACACSLQPLRKARVQRRVESIRAAVFKVVDPASKLLAVGEADGVGTSEGNHFLDREALQVGGERDIRYESNTNQIVARTSMFYPRYGYHKRENTNTKLIQVHILRLFKSVCQIDGFFTP